jgi:hypothetical protein
MSVMKPRDRLFLIRLTQEEYDTLKTAGRDRGARSTSDFARSLLLTAVGQSEGSGGGTLAEVCRTLVGLQEEVGRIADRIDRVAREEVPRREASEA